MDPFSVGQMAAQDLEGTDVCARDVHGLEVSRDHVELLQTYTPIWAQEESDRLAAWQAYLTSQAEQLNVSTGQTDQSSMHLWQRQVLTAVLMVSKHPHAATAPGKMLLITSYSISIRAVVSEDA